jgi:hypothetical protein
MVIVEIDMLKVLACTKTVQGRPEFHIISNDTGGEINPIGTSWKD